MLHGSSFSSLIHRYIPSNLSGPSIGLLHKGLISVLVIQPWRSRTQQPSFLNQSAVPWALQGAVLHRGH